jgi:hypothetical protein
VSKLVRKQGCNSRFQGGGYIEIKEYILKQGCLGYPKLSAILGLVLRSSTALIPPKMNRISANGNSTLCTSVIVPGSGYHVQSLSQVVQIHTTREKRHYIILLQHQSTTLRHKPDTSPTGLKQER